MFENSFRATQRNKMSENPDLEGRPSFSQRFSAGLLGALCYAGCRVPNPSFLKGGIPRPSPVWDFSLTAAAPSFTLNTGTANYSFTDLSVISSPLSIIANASRSCCSLMHSGGLV